MTLQRSAEAASLLAAAAAFAMISAGATASAQSPPGAPPPTWNAPPPQGPAQPPAPPPAFPPSLQAGGLTPPPSTMPPAPPVVDPNQNQTEKDLDKAQKENSRRGLEWFWLNAEGGFSYVDMRTFVVNNQDFTAGFVPTQAVGGTVGAGLGVRLLFITLGARGRIGLFDPWQMFTVGGEIGVHLPLGAVEPHFELGGGYAALGNVNGLVKGSSDAISISGGYGRLSAGVDVFLTTFLSIGVLGSGDFLGLVRPGLTSAQIQAIQNDPTISAARKAAASGFGTEGSSFGLAGGLTAVVGLHL